MNTIAGIRDVFLSVALSAAGLVSLGSAGIHAEEIVPSLDCPSCEDYSACTVDSCDATTGTCRHDPLDCDDGNPCMGADACTLDACDSALGCTHSIDLASCPQEVVGIVLSFSSPLGQGTTYQFILPKHKSGKDVFVELLARDGSVFGTFGPAERGP